MHLCTLVLLQKYVTDQGKYEQDIGGGILYAYKHAQAREETSQQGFKNNFQ